MMSSRETRATESLRVLLVEDEELVAELFAETLLEDGHDVVTAGDGEEALALFHEAKAQGRPYDVVVTDMRMPRMDGMTLTIRLRKERPKLPVVVVSGYAPPEQFSALSARQGGPLVLLPKPVSLSRLRSEVRRAAAH